MFKWIKKFKDKGRAQGEGGEELQEEEIPQVEEVPQGEEVLQGEEVPEAEAPEVEEAPQEEQVPEVEEVPQEEEVPEVEEVPQEEQVSEAEAPQVEEEVPEPEEPQVEEAPQVEEEVPQEEAPQVVEEPQVAEEPEMVEAVQEPREEKVGFFGRLKKGLKKTRQDFNYKINDILGNYVKIDEEMMEDLEDLLISADIGMETTMKLIDNLRDTIRDEQIQDPKEVKPLLAREMEAILNKNSEAQGLSIEPLPAIILVVGVNGVGKTTTIGKLAYRFQKEGRSVLIAAADTFRAAAIEQIKTWAERSNTPVIAHQEGSDPASVVYDGIQAAKSRGVDILICDTAGRLHNKKNLMNELEKINRVIQREYPEATKEHLLVLDATTGQNALLQAKTFHEATDLTGIVLTKLDGTAKGGVVLPLVDSMNLPIKLIGVGEGMEDLQDFSGADFARALLQEEG